MPAKRAPAKKKSESDGIADFRRPWAVRRFPNTNIARDLDPHERVKM